MITIIFGEAYQAKQYLKQLVAQHVQQGFELYALEAIDSEEKEIERNITNLLQAQSLFAKKKIIVVDDVDARFIKQVIEKQAKHVGESALVFLTQKQVAIKNKEIIIKQFTLPQDDKLVEFIQQEFTRRTFSAPQQILNALVLIQKNFFDLYWLVNEIEKISLAPNYAQELLARQEGANPFAITDALAQRKRNIALTFLEQEFNEGTQAVDILNRILWQLRVLLLVSSYQPTGESYKLALHPFVVQKARSALRAFSLLELKKLYLEAISLYENLLFSGLPSKLLLSQFFWQL